MMRIGGRLAATGLVLLLLGAAPQATAQPAVAQGTISRDQELAAGRIAAGRLIAQYPVLVDADWLAFLGQLRDALAPHAGRTDIDHQIILLDADVPNAISTPGYLFFTSGLLRLNLDRDAWAFLMGHELAHTARRHVAIELERARGAAVLNLLVLIATGSSVAGDVAELLVRVANLGHSRELEMEADVEGCRMMVEAGFDPEKAVAALQLFNEVTGRRQEQTHWTGTHPGFADRIARLTQARQRLLDQGLPARVFYFSEEVTAASLTLRPARLAERAREWTVLVEIRNGTASAVAINNTAIRLVLSDGNTVNLSFLRSTLGAEVPPNGRITGTVVFDRPDPAVRPARLIIPLAGPSGEVEAVLPVDRGGPFRPPTPAPRLPRPPGL